MEFTIDSSFAYCEIHQAYYSNPECISLMVQVYIKMFKSLMGPPGIQANVMQQAPHASLLYCCASIFFAIFCCRQVVFQFKCHTHVHDFSWQYLKRVHYVCIPLIHDSCPSNLSYRPDYRCGCWTNCSNCSYGVVGYFSGSGTLLENKEIQGNQERRYSKLDPFRLKHVTKWKKPRSQAMYSCYKAFFKTNMSCYLH